MSWFPQKFCQGASVSTKNSWRVLIHAMNQLCRSDLSIQCHGSKLGFLGEWRVGFVLGDEWKEIRMFLIRMPSEIQCETHRILRWEKDPSQHLAAQFHISAKFMKFMTLRTCTLTHYTCNCWFLQVWVLPEILTRCHWLKGFPARVAVDEQKTRPLVLDIPSVWRLSVHRGLTRHGTIWKVRILGGRRNRRKTTCGERIKIRSVLPAVSSMSFQTEVVTRKTLSPVERGSMCFRWR